MKPNREAPITAAPSNDRPTRAFEFSYRHAGAVWPLIIECFNWPDAKARATLLNLTFHGEVAEKRPEVIPEEATTAKA